LEKKKFVPDGEREDEAIHAKVKKHLMIKFMLLLKVQLNKNSAAFEK
jgi:hypothetical protein